MSLSTARTVALPLTLNPGITLSFSNKDPGSTLDYTLDCTAWLADIADTISSWTVTNASQTVVPLTIAPITNSPIGALLTAYVGGGGINQNYPLLFTIHTAGGRTVAATVWLLVQPQSANFNINSAGIAVLPGPEGPQGPQGTGIPTTPQAANAFLGGPASGSPATMTVRQLVMSDLPGGSTLAGVASVLGLAALLSAGGANGALVLDGSALAPLASLPALAAQAGSRAQSYVLAGPASGSGAAAWRQLVYTDIQGLGGAALLGAGTGGGVPVMDGSAKVQLINLPASVIGSNHYVGAWNASTNTPTLASSTSPGGPAPIGSYHVTSVAGSTSIDGVNVWNAGDWIIWDGTRWDKLDGQANPVSSVAGRQGAVTLAYADISGLGTAAQLVAGGANGAAVLDGSGNASPFTTLSTGSTTARSLAARGADWINIKDYGALLNGSSDTAAINSLTTASANNSLFFIPGGTWSATPALNSTKSFGWMAGGALNFSSGSSVQYMTDGDGFFNFNSGRWNFSKRIISSTNGYANVAMTLLNESGSQFANGYVVGNLVLNTTSQAGASGFTWGINSALTSGATNQNSSQDVGVSSFVNKSVGGAAATWQFAGLTTDLTGLPANSPSSILFCESDLACSGPEVSTTAYQAASGSRAGLHIVAKPYIPPVWSANAVKTKGAVITASPSNGYTFICSKAGTTGGSQPTFPSSIPSFAVASVSWATGIATIVTATPYQSGLTAGDAIYCVITGNTPIGYNINGPGYGAPIYATVVDGSTLTFPIAGNPGALTVAGTVSIAAVDDGTAGWSIGTTTAPQIDHFLNFETTGGAQVGTGLLMQATIYNAALELSYSTLVSQYGSSPAAIRLASNMPIDFSGNNTLAGQNVRTLQYNSSSGKFEYQKSGLAVLAIGDAGNTYVGGYIGINGSAGPYWKAGTGAPAYTAPKSSIYSRTDGGVGTTLYVSQGAGVWNAVAAV